jgi:anti-sigma-K factor RskA
MTNETTPRADHDRFVEALASYALDTLEGAERGALETHLESCRQCQDELAELRRVTAGLGMSVESVAPPASLRDRTLRRATAEPQPRLEAADASSPRSIRGPWLLAAASVLLALGVGTWALALRAELAAVQELAEVATTRAETLRAELRTLRQDATRLQQVVGVISAPDLQQVRLSGTGAAAGAAGRAYWSRALGLVFNASQLPALGADRSYELWVIPAGGAPISVGLLAVGTNGSASHTAALPDGLAVTTVAVTIEAAGGSPTGGPTTTPVLAGVLAS